MLSYKVISTEGHSPTDFNLMLMTEYKDLATMEANQDKGDALTQQMVGDDQKQMDGYKQRGEIREMIGDRLSREVILEPKQRTFYEHLREQYRASLLERVGRDGPMKG